MVFSADEIYREQTTQKPLKSRISYCTGEALWKYEQEMQRTGRITRHNSPQLQTGAKTAEAETVLVWSLYTEKGSDFCNHEVRRGPVYCACVIPPVLQTCCVYQWLHLWRQSSSSEFENVGPAWPEAGRYHGSDCPGESCILETVSRTD